MEITVLGNRYELLEKIGGGGMAIVYKARCRLLNRYVAVKILRDEFTEDEEFVRRFGIEAQSAASLSHPNIVPIYDVGNENGIYYIVMEYVDGITLKKYIDEKGSLEWREAVNIAIQICSAIEHAHSKKIIHRDIKPQNILVTKNGIAKVTDFGIARAATTSTITMAGSTIGSVHYFSPEQARGGYIDEKSDLYSLGIVLYEMVTGDIPFDGESPIAVALKHIQQNPVPPIEINKKIPKALNDIILKAMKKELLNRYQNASEMLEDLNRVLSEPNGDFAEDKIDDRLPTRKLKAISDDEIKGKQTTGRNGKTSVINAVNNESGKDSAFDIEPRKNRTNRNNKITDDYEPDFDDEENYEYEYEDDEDHLEKLETEGNNKINKNKKGKVKKKGSNKSIVIAVIISFIIIIIFAYIAYVVISNSMSQEAEKFVVKTYVGKEFNEEIINELKSANIDIIENWVYDDDTDYGIIISQSVEPGFEFKLSGYNSIEFTISKGPELVTIPDLSGKPVIEAEITLQQMLRVKPRIIEEYSDIFPAGQVISTFPPANEKVKPDTEVIIYKSMGPEIRMTTVPDLTGKTYAEADVILYEYNLKLGKYYPEDKNPANAKIVRQDPAPGETVKEETTVDVYLSQTKYVDVPIEVSNLDMYDDTIEVVVQITTSDTQETKIFYENEVNKSEFPIIVKDVPIPENGSTKMRVFLDDSLRMEINLDWAALP